MAPAVGLDILSIQSVRCCIHSAYRTRPTVPYVTEGPLHLAQPGPSDSNSNSNSNSNWTRDLHCKLLVWAKTNC